MADTEPISPAPPRRHLHKAGFPATRGECDRVVAAPAALPDRHYTRPADVSRAFAGLAGGYSEGVAYPARRDDLIACPPVVDALRRVLDRRYDAPEAVAGAIAEE